MVNRSQQGATNPPTKGNVSGVFQKHRGDAHEVKREMGRDIVLVRGVCPGRLQGRYSDLCEVGYLGPPGKAQLTSRGGGWS